MKNPKGMRLSLQLRAPLPEYSCNECPAPAVFLDLGRKRVVCADHVRGAVRPLTGLFFVVDGVIA